MLSKNTTGAAYCHLVWFNVKIKKYWLFAESPSCEKHVPKVMNLINNSQSEKILDLLLCSMLVVLVVSCITQTISS